MMIPITVKTGDQDGPPMGRRTGLTQGGGPVLPNPKPSASDTRVCRWPPSVQRAAVIPLVEEDLARRGLAAVARREGRHRHRGREVSRTVRYRALLVHRNRWSWEDGVDKR